MSDVMQKPRLLFHLPALTDGGAERTMALIASQLAEAGYPVRLVAERAAVNGPPVSSAVRFSVLDAGHAGAIAGLRQILRKERPAVAVSAVAASPLKLTIAAAGLNIELVHTVHGFHEHATGRLTALSWRLWPLIARRAAAIVAVSDALRGELVANRGVPASKTHVIHNPVALPDPLPGVTAEELAARRPAILAIGRLSGEKQFGLLLKALAAMRTEQATLTILGDGPQRDILRTMAQRLHIADRVTFAGFVSDVWPHLAAAKVLAVPSRTESFGLAAVEALAAGLPVAATRTPGLMEVMGEDARLGRLVEITDHEGLAAALDDLLADPGDPAPRQRRAKAFSVAAGMARWRALIDRLTG